MIEWRDIKLNQFIKININDDVNNCEKEEDDIQYNTYGIQSIHVFKLVGQSANCCGRVLGQEAIDLFSRHGTYGRRIHFTRLLTRASGKDRFTE